MNNNGEKKNYIGLTIGPIVSTLQHANDTGSLWASSYVFSYVMKKIIKNIINKKSEFGSDIEERFIVPAIDDVLINNEKHEVGLFHDRLIFQSRENDFNNLGKVIDEVLNDIANELIKLNDIPKEDNNEMLNYVKQFFKIYYLEVEVDPNDKNENDRNIIFKVSKYLDAMELREQFIDKDSQEYIIKFLNNSYKIKNSFLAKEAYEDGYRKDSYPSLLRISLGKFVDENWPYEDDEIKKYISNKNINLKKANEYLALVQVDGDFMGKVIERFNEKKEYKNFSKKLLEHAKKSNEIIKEYGGFTIFAGGDDLLFLAPIMGKGDKNIFDLIECISTRFDDSFGKLKSGDKKPSLSFGVEIVNYKFPLYFALDEARNLLFSKAKNFKENDKEKNAVAFKVTKGSGKSFSVVASKESQSYKTFIQCLDLILNKNTNSNIKNSLNSIHIKLLRDKNILNEIAIKYKEQLNNMITNYFDNNFNEDIHGEEAIKEYIKVIKDLIIDVYSNSDEKKIKDDISIKEIYSYLNFIKFMDEKSDLKVGKKDE